MTMPIQSLLLAALLSSRTWANGITLVTEGFPPYSYLDASGQVSGFSTELIREVCKLTQDCTGITLLPWNRAYAMAQNLPDHALFSVYRRPERENEFKWVGPLSKARVVFFTQRDSQVTINSLEEAHNVKKIGVQRNSIHHLYLQGQGFRNLVVTVSADRDIGNTNLRMLLAGRFDLWMATEASAYEKVKRAGISSEEIKPVFTVFTEDLYIAFNRSTSDHIIYRWQAALDEVRRSPVHYKLMAEFLGASTSSAQSHGQNTSSPP
ncbi:transporter substrate-binding domain-containing protein [Herbaspirillum sp. HC18]|nr:transporter substrate-binding domain-containing protein [Herbaspirillum sp. HC18]